MEIFIEKPVLTGVGKTKIYILDSHGRERYRIGYNSESKLLNRTLLNENEPYVEPFIELPEDVFAELTKAFVRHANATGFKTESESMLEGKLAAKEVHLEDLRNQFDLVLKKIVSIA